MEEEIDIISIIDSMRKTRVLTELMFDKQQKFLAENQQINLIFNENSVFSEYPRGWKPPKNKEDLCIDLQKLNYDNLFDYENKITKELANQILGVRYFILILYGFYIYSKTIIFW